MFHKSRLSYKILTARKDCHRDRNKNSITQLPVKFLKFSQHLLATGLAFKKFNFF